MRGIAKPSAGGDASGDQDSEEGTDVDAGQVDEDEQEKKMKEADMVPRKDIG